LKLEVNFYMKASSMRTSLPQPSQTDISPGQPAWIGAREPSNGSLFPAVAAAVLVHAGVLLASPEPLEHPSARPHAELTWFEATMIAPASDPLPVTTAKPQTVHAVTPRRREAQPAAEATEQTSENDATATPAVPVPAAVAPAASTPATDAAATSSVEGATGATAVAASHSNSSAGMLGAQRSTTGATLGPPTPGESGLRGAPTSGAAPVRLPSREWRCPWPAEAEYEDFDEQLVAIRVVVATDGSVESAQLVSDPGFGFGAAARDCARRARFTPARDDSGRAVRALSPPIHVRFVR